MKRRKETMKEKKCTSQEASFYINDLFEMLEIKGNNQLLFNQFCSVLMKYSLDTIKKAWPEIVNSCDLPNGQLAGRIPKMQIIENLLMNHRIDNFTSDHRKIKKQEPAQSGLINKLWEWGLQLRDGKITKQELDKKIQEYGNE